MCVSALCCAGQACCGCLCGCCMKVCKTGYQHHTRIGYFSVLFIASGFGLLFLYFSEEMISPLEEVGLSDCKDDSEESICLGVQAIYRLSFALLLFFALVLAMSIPGGKLSSLFNRNFLSRGLLAAEELSTDGVFRDHFLHSELFLRKT